MITLDLFADPAPSVANSAVEVAGTPDAPAAASMSRSRAEGENFTMQPTGDVNRWLYKGVAVVFDNRRKAGSHLGQWQTVEGIGLPVLHSDDRIEVCRAIDARIVAKDRT